MGVFMDLSKLNYPECVCKDVRGLQTAEEFAKTNPPLGTIVVMTWGGENYFAEVVEGVPKFAVPDTVRLISTVSKQVDYSVYTGQYDYTFFRWFVVAVLSRRYKVGRFIP